jgi:hypothetical protein
MSMAEPRSTPKLLPAAEVAAADPLERRLYDGAAVWCCTSQRADHPGSYSWRVGLLRGTDGFEPADPHDTACPECGAAGQQVSQVRSWTRLHKTTYMFGAVLDTRDGKVCLWVPGATPEDGTWMDPPAGLPEDLRVAGETFEVEHDNGDLAHGTYYRQRHADTSLEELLAHFGARIDASPRDIRRHIAASHPFHGDPWSYPEAELREEHDENMHDDAAAEHPHPPYPNADPTAHREHLATQPDQGQV